MEKYKINMSELAKKYGVKFIDTFDTIQQEEIDQKQAEGYDLWQVVSESNQHLYFEFCKKEITQ
jgi:hypothetical protein